jgi:hypothetical protein
MEDWIERSARFEPYWPELSQFVLFSGKRRVGKTTMAVATACTTATGQMVALKQTLAEQFGIRYVTIQMEAVNCGRGRSRAAERWHDGPSSRVRLLGATLSDAKENHG